MKSWLSWPRTSGTASRQAHADMPQGTFEREMGKEGFWGPATHLHHKKAPTGWRCIEGPLKPRAFDTTHFDENMNSPLDARLLMFNHAIKVRMWKTDTSMTHLVRNADGDDMLFIHEGEGELYCDFGHMSFRAGDFIVLPRSTMWRITLSGDTSLCALMVEATSDSLLLPDKGLLGEHAFFDPAIIDTPEINDAFLAQQDDEEWLVKIKRLDEITTVTYPYNPLDAVGWHGTLLPMKVNWRDFRPIMSHRYHIPPSIHCTFIAERFMITTFCPRPVESDPGALKLPFYHNNNDYDEVIFYHKGTFLSRDTIGPGMMSYHPYGLTHGPHPKAYEKALRAERKQTDEVAVMIDTRDPLEVAKSASQVEKSDYVDSWK